ncbi:hypothetical protein J7I94_19095 [Streptomyces sp. ISL-12]|uniref:hypothetical protein n=1 Tax=Streptomyces sp. ISL-12 TaxID=2819177 RepID=UPI001BE71D9F|nr:hypothetical protein [Streptomyces sp. ISL-12]MBT2412641.1 hypothetical protein [Streptomyces sp. ISL-12]
MAITGNLLPANAESIETDASAWSALVNASSLARTTGGTLGTYSLLWRATAVGDSQIGLATRVAVTAGGEFWACASIFPPAVGAQSRIEVRWYNSGGTLISTSQGPVISAPAATWHQVAVVGTAPATAATANVVIRVTGTAASQAWFTDRVFLGLVAKSTGNLLSWNAESIEVDTTGWAIEGAGAASVSRTAAWWYQSLLVTSTSTGAVTAQTAETPAVTPGVEYAGYAYVVPDTTANGLPLTITIQWLDGSGTVVGTSSSSWTPTMSAWTRVTIIGTAPAEAVSARLALSTTATATSQQWAIDRVVLAPTSALSLPGNLLPYGTADMEQDVSAWTVTGGTGTQSSESWATGAHSLKLVADGSGDLVASTTQPVPAGQEGVGYMFAPRTRQLADRRYRTRIEWLDSTGEAVRTRWQSWAGVATGWLTSSIGDLAVTGAVAVRLSIIVPGAPAGDTWYVDAVEWKVGGLTAYAEPAAGGGARITLRGLTGRGPTWLWSLTRLVAGEAPAPVRGYSGDLTAQSVVGDVAVVTDYEAPLGVPVYWRVAMWDPNGVGTLSYTSDPVTLTAETTDVWLKDPGLPQRSVKLTVATPMPTWQRQARQNVSQVRGRRLPVVISDVRGGKTGTLTVVTETADDRDALWWVLDAGGPLLLQWPPHWDEDDIYVTVGDVSAAPVVDYAEFSDRTWSLPLTEVDRPTGGITGSADRTWETVATENATWADVLAGTPTWLDVYTGA